MISPMIWSKDDFSVWINLKASSFQLPENINIMNKCASVWLDRSFTKVAKPNKIYHTYLKCASTIVVYSLSGLQRTTSKVGRTETNLVNFSKYAAHIGVPTRQKKAHLHFCWASIYLALRQINIVVIPSTSQSRKSSPVCKTNLAFEVPMPDPRPSFWHCSIERIDISSLIFAASYVWPSKVKYVFNSACLKIENSTNKGENKRCFNQNEQFF